MINKTFVDYVIGLEGDQRCIEDCPHFVLQKDKRGKEKGYCKFYKRKLIKHDLLNGYFACLECLNDCKGGENG